MHICVRACTHTHQRERLFSFCMEVFLSVHSIRTLDLPQADFTSPRAPLRSVYPEDDTEHAQEQGQLQKDQDLEVDAAPAACRLTSCPGELCLVSLNSPLITVLSVCLVSQKSSSSSLHSSQAEGVPEP